MQVRAWEAGGGTDGEGVGVGGLGEVGRGVGYEMLDNGGGLRMGTTHVRGLGGGRCHRC